MGPEFWCRGLRPRSYSYFTSAPIPRNGVAKMSDPEDLTGPRTHMCQPRQGKIRTTDQPPPPHLFTIPRNQINLLFQVIFSFPFKDTLNDVFYLDGSLKPLSHPEPFLSIPKDPGVVAPLLPLESAHLGQPLSDRLIGSRFTTCWRLLSVFYELFIPDSTIMR